MQAVLLVEDLETDIDLTRRVFEINKVRNPLDVCKTGGEALVYLQSQQTPLPCLVLLHLWLPYMIGRNVLKVSPSDPRTKDLCVFVLTFDGEQEGLLMALGANSF